MSPNTAPGMTARMELIIPDGNLGTNSVQRALIHNAKDFQAEKKKKVSEVMSKVKL